MIYLAKFNKRISKHFPATINDSEISTSYLLSKISDEISCFGKCLKASDKLTTQTNSFIRLQNHFSDFDRLVWLTISVTQWRIPRIYFFIFIRDLSLWHFFRLHSIPWVTENVSTCFSTLKFRARDLRMPSKGWFVVLPLLIALLVNTTQKNHICDHEVTMYFI